MNTPEERIQCTFEDWYTVVVKTGIVTLPQFKNTFLHGVRVTAAVGTLHPAFSVQHVNLHGTQALTNFGHFTILGADAGVNVIGTHATAHIGAILPPETDITGNVFVTASAGLLSAVPALLVGLSGLAANSQINTLVVEVSSTQPPISGVSVTSHVGGPVAGIVYGFGGLSATTQISVPERTATGIGQALVGVQANTRVNSHLQRVAPHLISLQVTAQVNTMQERIGFGQQATAQIGTLQHINITYTGSLHVAATAAVGILRVDPNRVALAGVEATTAVGAVSLSVMG